MQVKIAGHEDIAAMSSVLAASWKSAYRGIVNDDYLDLLPDNHWVESLTAGLNNGNIFAMTLEYSQRMIGAAIIGQGETGNAANLLSFYLLPEMIGQGFGHAFYNGIEIELRRKAFSKCVLDVLEHNERAIRFYEAHGFTNTGKTVKATLGNCEYLCRIYEKILVTR